MSSSLSSVEPVHHSTNPPSTTLSIRGANGLGQANLDWIILWSQHVEFQPDSDPHLKWVRISKPAPALSRVESCFDPYVSQPNLTHINLFHRPKNPSWKRFHALKSVRKCERKKKNKDKKEFLKEEVNTFHFSVLGYVKAGGDISLSLSLIGGQLPSNKSNICCKNQRNGR